MAELLLNRSNDSIDQLKHYHLTGMRMVKLSQKYGDNGHHLRGLIKIHHRGWLKRSMMLET
ncbi:hypothetical protein PCO85_12390 [Prodigiosinella aquatilis]|nr:hypothetical protein [Prodigiosinella sp. LS101]WJV52056.1 hypothetical protein PCO85_12390 [Prodigiosinella sp. LS101]WJV56413.1 hypothetical protein PCO84_12395 [Pectobacteriaceae bacterium C111]